MNDLLQFIKKHTDNDGLVDGDIISAIDQENVKIKDYWFKLDARIHWMFGQCAIGLKRDQIPLSLRVNLTQYEHESSHFEPMRKAYWWGNTFNWDKIDEKDNYLETVHGDENQLNPLTKNYAKTNFKWNSPKEKKYLRTTDRRF